MGATRYRATWKQPYRFAKDRTIGPAKRKRAIFDHTGQKFAMGDHVPLGDVRLRVIRTGDTNANLLMRVDKRCILVSDLERLHELLEGFIFVLTPPRIIEIFVKDD